MSRKGRVDHDDGGIVVRKVLASIPFNHESTGVNHGRLEEINPNIYIWLRLPLLSRESHSQACSQSTPDALCFLSRTGLLLALL